MAVEVEAGVRLMQMADWAYRFYVESARWKIVEGGRGSGKSVGAHQALMMRGMAEPQRLLCLRETQKSLEDSSHALIRDLCDEHPASFGQFYKVRRNRVEGANGTQILFRGLSEAHGTARAMRSLRNISVAMIEEGQFISDESFEILVPTIREAKSEIWAALNPRYPDDPVYRQGRSGDPDVMHFIVNWSDNKWWNPVQEAERRRFKRQYPERYDHIYEGALDTEGLGLKQVLSYALLEDCIEMHAPEHAAGRPEVGFDVADEGNDQCAVVAAVGPCIVAIDRWSGKGRSIAYSTERALRFASEHGAWRLNYDAGGLGAGVKSEVRKLRDPGFEVRGIAFNGRVTAPKRRYAKTRSNADEFMNRGAQLGWNLHLRAQNTRQLREGRDVRPSQCLFIDPAVPRLRDVKAQLSQPVWDYSGSGRIRIVKAEKGQQSPDIYDALALARASDTDRGLSSLGAPVGFADLYGG